METHLIFFIATGVFIIIEAVTPGSFIAACFALATLIVALLDMFTGLGFKMLLGIDLALTILFLVTVKPFLRSTILPNSDEALTYTQKLIGEEAMVFKEVQSNHSGAVKLFDSDEVWSAKSKNDPIGIGSTVKIIAAEGNVLIVEAV